MGFFFFFKQTLLFLFLKGLQAYGPVTLLAFIFFRHLGQFSLIFIPPIFINLFGRALMWNFDPTGPTHIIFFYTHLCSIIFKQKLYCEDWVVSPSSKGVHDFRFDLQHTITITSAWNTISTRRPKNGLFF